MEEGEGLVGGPTDGRTCWMVCARARWCLRSVVLVVVVYGAHVRESTHLPPRLRNHSLPNQPTKPTEPHVGRTYFPIPCTAMAVAAIALLSVGALGSRSAAKPSPTWLFVCVCVCVSDRIKPIRAMIR